MGKIFSGILDFLKTVVLTICNHVLGLLPSSPFTGINQYIGSLDIWGYINWFVPVSTLLKITTAWLGAIAVYYLYLVIARWVKLVG